MKARLAGPPPKSKTSIAISIAAHVVLFVGLAAITFHYPLIDLFRRPTPTPEVTLRYVRVAPEKPPVVVGSGRSSSAAARRAAAPRTVLAPSTIPVGIPKASAPTPNSRVVIGANADPGRQSITVGVQPGIPDSRLATNPMAVGHLPRTDAQKADSALSAIYDMYVDSVKAQLARGGRAPGDWSWGGKDGDKWGWDPNGIHLGGITIPNAVLAALPLNIGPGGRNMNSITELRADAYMRADIQSHANLMSQDDFRATIQRIRDLADRQRQEKMAKRRKDPPPP